MVHFLFRHHTNSVKLLISVCPRRARMEIDYLLHIHLARGPYLENIVRGPSGTDPAKRSLLRSRFFDATKNGCVGD